MPLWRRYHRTSWNSVTITWDNSMWPSCTTGTCAIERIAALYRFE